MISASGLKAAIKSEVTSREIATTYVSSIDDKGKPVYATMYVLPNDHGDALYEAIATAVINYLKTNLEIRGTVSSASLPFTTPLSAPGYVVTPATLEIAGGTIQIAAGGVY